jgi:hypothetical protein
MYGDFRRTEYAEILEYCAELRDMCTSHGTVRIVGSRGYEGMGI